MTELEKAFKEYRAIAEELHNKVREYCHYFSLLRNQELKENILQEDVSEEEKEEIDKKIEELETTIHNLFIRFLNHANTVERAIQREKIVDFNLINMLNEEHIDVMEEYISVIKRFKSLKKKHPKYDFDSVIDFSEMERQKMKLNDAILDFNLRFSAITKIQPLYKIEDCRLIAKEREDDLYSSIDWSEQNH